MAHFSMDSTSARSSRPPRRQRLLPALTPAPVTAGSSTATAKFEQQPTDCSDGLRPVAPTGKKPTSIAHIFFNRKPLDLIRRTTSSLLASGGASSATAVSVTEPATEERKFWQPHRPQGEKNGRRRLQQLQQREKDRAKEDHKQVEHRKHHSEEVDSDRRKKHEHSGGSRRRQTPCPLTGKQFLLDAGAEQLTGLERVEIQQYDEIKFVSTLAIKRQRRNGKIQNDLPVHADDVPVLTEELEDLPVELYNDGYDDEQGDYLVLLGDHLAFRYEVLHFLGQGSFGQVVCCLNHRTGKQVAVKIIRNRRKYRDQALVEVQLLSQLQRAAAGCTDSPRVVHMEEYFLFRNHVCITFELLGANLYDFLKLRFFHGIPMSSIQKIATQLAQALAFLKQQQIVHCDLKPENVLLETMVSEGGAQNNGDLGNVTLIDFGSSSLEGAPMFTYIQSRFYRSPEVLLGYVYTGAIDMWSFACILVELHTGHPIFAGENEREQLACIMEVLGVPPTDVVRKSKRCLNYFDEVVDPVDNQVAEYVPKPFVNSRGRRRTLGPRNLATVVKSDDPEFLAFLAKCFIWEPSQRLTPEQALQEPWLCRYVRTQGVNFVEYEL